MDHEDSEDHCSSSRIQVSSVDSGIVQASEIMSTSASLLQNNSRGSPANPHPLDDIENRPRLCAPRSPHTVRDG